MQTGPNQQHKGNKHRQGPLGWIAAATAARLQDYWCVLIIWDLIADYLEPTLTLSDWTEVSRY